MAVRVSPHRKKVRSETFETRIQAIRCRDCGETVYSVVALRKHKESGACDRRYIVNEREAIKTMVQES